MSPWGGRRRNQRPRRAPKVLDTRRWITCVGLFCITSTMSHYHIKPKKTTLYLLSLSCPSCSSSQLNCPDYPALVTQFSSLCHFLNKDIYLFSSFTTAPDSTRKKKEQAREVMPLSAAMTGRAGTSTLANRDGCRLAAVARQADLRFVSQAGRVRKRDSSKEQWSRGNEGMDKEELAGFFCSTSRFTCWDLSPKEWLQG